MQAEIISIGDEILIGQTVNTNATWMGEKLNAIGIRVHRVTSIADSREDIIRIFDEASSRSQVILITGGLGPTKDDITKKTMCDYFNTELVLDQTSLERIQAFFEGRGLPMLEVNRQQAMVPKDATVLHNLRGTANGMWFERNGVVFVSMPGVPYEMQWLMQEEVLPRIQTFFKRPDIVHRTILTTGVGESFLADTIKDWEDSLEAEDIKLAYLPSPGAVKLRMSAYGGGDKKALEEKIAKKEVELMQLIGQHVFGYGKDTLASVIGELLVKEKMTLAVAESCTGGMIAHMVTDVPGSSRYFVGGMVPYTEQAKVKLVGVKQSTLDAHSVYSAQIAEELAQGAKERYETDFGIGTTGVAGPEDLENGIKAGTIWIGVSGPSGTVSKQLKLGKNRERNILMASNAALNLLRQEIIAINH